MSRTQYYTCTFSTPRALSTPETYASIATRIRCVEPLLRIPEVDFSSKQMMLILCDRYGNEKKLVFAKSDFT